MRATETYFSSPYECASYTHAGNDGVGKSALLSAAKRSIGAADGDTKKSESSGCIYEMLALRGTQLHVCDVTASGTGAYMFLRALEAFGDGDGSALLHVIRASDRRLWSSLWELYSIVKSFRSPSMAVCVVVLRDDAAMWPALETLASREALPPGGTRVWPKHRRWAECTVGNQTSQKKDEGEDSTTVKSPIRAGSVVRSRGASSTENFCGDLETQMEVHDDTWIDAAFDWDSEGLEEDRLHVATQGDTQSHGFGVVQNCFDSPPLETLHHGPWLVMPIDSLTDARDALMPFTWLASVLNPAHSSQEESTLDPEV